MSIYHLNTYLSFICRHHSTSYRPDHAICSDSSNHFVTLTPTNTPLYHQHQGNGTYYLATSLKGKTLTYLNFCYVTIILQSIANIIYYIISVYILLFVKFSQQKKNKQKNKQTIHQVNNIYINNSQFVLT